MRFLSLACIASFASFASLLALGCAAPESDSVDSNDAGTAGTAGTAGSAGDEATGEAALTGGTTYYRLERNADGTFTASRANGGKWRCNGVSAARCNVAALELPADCNWECTDGLLSFRGVVFVRGTLVSAYDKAAGKRITKLVVAAGFDAIEVPATTNRQYFPYYRITQNGEKCAGGAVRVCTPRYKAVRLDASGATTVEEVDFSAARDVNYVIDPLRGFTQIARPEGLLASGSIRGGVFTADWIFRQWTPLACDVPGAARAYFFLEPAEGEVNLEFATAGEAQSYQDPEGRTVHWIAADGIRTGAIAYVGGTNDLWAQTFDVSAATCAVTLTGEH